MFAKESAPKPIKDQDVRWAVQELGQIETVKESVALSLKSRALELSDPLKDKLPSLLFVSAKNISSSSDAWALFAADLMESEDRELEYHDNSMYVIVFEPKTGNLYDLNATFVDEREEGGYHTFAVGWQGRYKVETQRKEAQFNYFDKNPFGQPYHSEKDMWLEHGVKTIKALKEAKEQIEKGIKVTPPKHKTTDHKMVPNKLPVPYSKIRHRRWKIKSPITLPSS